MQNHTYSCAHPLLMSFSFPLADLSLSLYLCLTHTHTHFWLCATVWWSEMKRVTFCHIMSHSVKTSLRFSFGTLGNPKLLCQAPWHAGAACRCTDVHPGASGDVFWTPMPFCLRTNDARISLTCKSQILSDCWRLSNDVMCFVADWDTKRIEHTELTAGGFCENTQVLMREQWEG